MTTVRQITAASRTTTSFAQFVRLPLLGEAWVEREADRPQGVPFFDSEVDRGGGEAGAARATDPMTGFTIRAGRWVVVVDRPGGDAASAAARGPTGLLREGAWLAFGGPLVALVGVAACVVSGAAKGLLAALRRL